MKLKVTVGGSLMQPAFGRLVHRIRDTVLPAATIQRIERELHDELQAVSARDRAANPASRRDALERAIRRIRGASP